METNIVFLHIPKTAGLTLNFIFGENWGFDRIKKLGVRASANGQSSELIELREYIEESQLLKNPKGLVFSGHFPFGIVDKLKVDAIQMTALRHPVSRTISLYHYLKRSNETNLELKDWLKSNFEANNGMCKRLAGIFENQDGEVEDFSSHQILSKDFECSEEHFELALSNLKENFDLVFLQENFSEGMVMLQNLLKSRPLYSLFHQFRNHSNTSNWIDQVDSDSIEQIEALNYWDLRLYEEISKEISSRQAGLGKQFEEQLEIYRLINEILKPPPYQTMSAQILSQNISKMAQNFMQTGRCKELLAVLEAFLPRFSQEQSFLNFYQQIKSSVKVN